MTSKLNGYSDYVPNHKDSPFGKRSSPLPFDILPIGEKGAGPVPCWRRGEIV